MMEKGIAISVSNLSKKYDKKIIFENFSLDIYSGEILCILGESGGGKTTLLNLIAFLTDSDAGEITFNLQNGGEKKHIAYAFQEDTLLPNLTALQNLTFVGGDKDYSKTLLEKAGLSDCINKRPSALSGGEKQRVSLLRAFSKPFDLLLADEPFSSLDVASKERMVELFHSLWSENNVKKDKTAVIVTHSIKEAIEIADRVVVLKSGNIALDEYVPKGEEEKTSFQKKLLIALHDE